MIKFLVFSISTLLFICHSQTFASNGFYIGAQLGWGNVHQGEFINHNLQKMINRLSGDIDVSPIKSIYTNTGFAGRLFLGYQINPYISLESGYTHYSHLNMDTTLNATIKPFKAVVKKPILLDLSLHTEATTYIVDAICKFSWPFYERFNVYGKLGLSYLNVNSYINLSTGFNFINFNLASNPSLSLVYPTFGLGIGYALTEHVTSDLSWTRIQRYTSNFFPSVDFIAFGVIYYF